MCIRDRADITDQDHQEKNTDTENTNSDKEQGTEESTDSDKIVTAYVSVSYTHLI